MSDVTFTIRCEAEDAHAEGKMSAAFRVDDILALLTLLDAREGELSLLRNQGHAESCAGMDAGGGRCACGWLQGHGAHAAYTRTRDERDALATENAALREALVEIRTTQGKVCEEYELCTHRACASSYASWAIAEKALAHAALGED